MRGRAVVSLTLAYCALELRACSSLAAHARIRGGRLNASLVCTVSAASLMLQGARNDRGPTGGTSTRGAASLAIAAWGVFPRAPEKRAEASSALDDQPSKVWHSFQPIFKGNSIWTRSHVIENRHGASTVFAACLGAGRAVMAVRRASVVATTWPVRERRLLGTELGERSHGSGIACRLGCLQGRS
jgi:hypothetical protein